MLSWEGVTARDYSFASIVFYFNDKEIGHIHGDAVADIRFPKKISKKLVSDGRVLPHHIVPKSEWVSHKIESKEDVKTVIELFRMEYERLKKDGKSG